MFFMIGAKSIHAEKMQIDEVVQRLGSGGPSINGGSGRGVGRHLVVGRGQWKPALQSIAESATS